MKKISFKSGIWLLIFITSIAGALLTKGGIYTKLSKDIQGGLTLPSFSLPLVAIVAILLVEQMRRKYPDTYVNVVLGLIWIVLVGLIISNM